MDQASEIREKIDIIGFISEYIPLKKAGRNFKANCPFHNENTPSLVVSPERQIWHCFGCGKGGDVFTFLMEYESMEFLESLRFLAKKTGVMLKESDFKKSEYSEKEKIFEINNLSLKFYHFLLTEHKAGKKALDYLINSRKVTKLAIDNFMIGFAPTAGSTLSEFLVKKKGFSNKDLILAGVSFERNGKIYDFFQERIIFPLFDHRGNVTGFSGRGLSDAQMPKYINTKETSVYHKGSMFFGLNIAKDEIKQKQDAIIVEGEFDAISLFQENIKNVVAIKGTALTDSQVGLLSRFTPKVTLCLDMDTAGFEATKRSLEVLEKRAITADIIILENSKDPDEAIKENPLIFKKALKEKTGVYDYLIEKISNSYSLDTASGKRDITNVLLPLLSNISNEIIKEHYLKKISKVLDVSYESLVKEADKHKNKGQEEKIVIVEKNKRTRRQLLEEYLTSLIIQKENLKDDAGQIEDILGKYVFESTAFAKILRKLKENLSQKSFSLDSFAKYLPEELAESFNTCFLFPLPKFETKENYNQEVDKVYRELLSIYVKQRINELSKEIKENEIKKNKEEVVRLKQEFAKLILLIPKNSR